MAKKDEIEAYSVQTDTVYENWYALIEAEANGYVVTCIITSTLQDKVRSWPWTIGPFETEKEAEKVRNRLRAKFKREGEYRYPHQTYKWFVRPVWKPEFQ